MTPAQLRLPRGRRPVPTHTSLRTRPLPVVLYVAGLVLLPVLLVTGAMTTGWWSTAGHGGSSSAVPAGRTDPARAPDAAGPADPADPADVKGSMTLREVADAFSPVTAAEIVAAFGAPTGVPDTAQLRTLVEDGNGMDMPTFRTWLQQRVTTRPAP